MDRLPGLHPIGPLPAAVYWRRRAAALVAVVVVGWLLAALLSGGASGSTASNGATSNGGARVPVAGRSSSPPPAVGTVTATPTTTPAAHRSVPRSTGTPTAAPTTGTPTPAASSTAAAVVPTCRDGDLTVAVTVDQPTYGSGTDPRLLLTVTNTSGHACRSDLGTDARSFTVYSGSDRIWSSADCAHGSATVAVLTPKQSIAYAGTWARRRSSPASPASPACPSSGTAALPGTYRLFGRLGALVSAPVVFGLV